MGCEITRDETGTMTAIICTRGGQRCRWCSRRSTKLCDYAAPGSRKTCDAPMCNAHAKMIGPNVDHCPDHSTPMVEAR